MNIKGMDRRGFLGIFGGAAVAGPRLAAGIAENAAMLTPVPPSTSYGIAAASTESDDSWKVRRIKELKAVISGSDPAEQQSNRMARLYALEQGERLRLDSLRSVSSVHKQRMLTEGAASRHSLIRRADAEWDLKRLLSGN